MYAWLNDLFIQNSVEEKRDECTHKEILCKFYESKLILDCDYYFLIDLSPIGIPIGAKSIGKGWLQIKGW